MPIDGEGTFRNANWDETTTQSFYGGAKLARVELTRTYEGAITGESTVEYLMATGELGDVRFVGMETLNGSVGGFNGTILIQHVGTFSGGKARSAWMFVEGTGSGDLGRVTGEGTFESIDRDSAKYTVSYTAEGE